MELRIDNQRCDLPTDFALTLSWEGPANLQAESLREGKSLKIDLPATPTNDTILSDARIPYAPERFNRSLHSATIIHDGVTLFEGVVRLWSCRPEHPKACYRIELRGGAASWAKAAARGELSELPISYQGVLLPSTICDSWSDSGPVKFLPIRYDDYRAPYAEGSLLPVEQILSIDDFHPFLQLDPLIRAIFSQSGYTLESRFMESAWWRSLYISGAYPSADCSARKARMDFCACRTTTAEAEANELGRVYCSPFMVVNSVGNLADAYRSGTLDDEGNLLTECFSTNGCLTIEQGELLFRPLSAIEVGFEYHLHYQSDYRILTRNRLQGFDTLYLGTGAEYHFELANRFVDCRTKARKGIAYRLVVFDHPAGANYRLLQGGQVVSEFSERSTLVVPLFDTEQQPPTLEQLDPERGEWVAYTEDWALYEGYVEERGTTEAELTMRTSPESLSPTSPKHFHQIYLAGAEEGMKLRLMKGCQIRPTFRPRPAFGATLGWADITHHGVRQSELLDAVAALFDWVIFTDEEQKRVFIEPYGDFYQGEQAVDWSSRQVAGELTIEESDHLEHEARRYGYRPTDGEVLRLNRELDSPFGEWVVQSASMATLEGEEDRRSVLFAPTLNRSGHFEGAPSALIPTVGNRDDELGVEELSFSPRIVGYLGMKALPEGERLGAPAPVGSYPLAAFHFAGDQTSEGFSLCFEERDGVAGIYRFHEAREAVRERGRIVRLKLRLSAMEVEGLRHLETKWQAGANSLFRLRHGEEPLRCRLEAVESYNPAEGIASCRFCALNDDRP